VASYGASNAGGNAGERYWEGEREGVVTGVKTGGVCLSVREREGERGLGWFGAGWAGWFPGSAQLASGLSFLFFSSASLFSFISEFLFCVLEEFFHSDLNKKSKLTTSGLLKVCLETKPEVLQ
jgi:hypothetical protein